MTFSELGLKAEILQGLQDLGFESPTPIQEKAVPALVEGARDLVGLAQTGTGKTAAFGLPLLNQIDEEVRASQALVLCPTRELCLQIAKDFENFSKYQKGVNVLAVYGGSSIERQMKNLKKGVNVVVATPGRLVDLIKRRAINLNEVRICVLDEADEMLNMGFKDDLDFILSKTPDYKNTWLFSATMPKEVARIASEYMSKPLEITVGSKNASASTIKHIYHYIHDKNRYKALKSVLDFHPDIYGIVFCQTRHATRDVADRLIQDGYNADALHGDLSQEQRDYVMNKFRNKSLQVLVATDVAARGIDVDNVTHVIHHSLPDDVENYTHRSGRTGRAGNKGESIALVNRSQRHKVKEIAKIIGKEIEYKLLPTGEDICDVQLKHLVETVHKNDSYSSLIDNYQEYLIEAFSDLTKEEIVKKFVSIQFDKFLRYYANSKDLNQPKEGDFNKEFKRAKDGYKRYFIGVGRKDGINPGAIIRLICDQASINGDNFGRIDLKDEFSFFQVKEDIASKIDKNLTSFNFEGKEVRVEESKEPLGSRDRGRGRGRGGSGRNRGGGSGQSKGKRDYNRRGNRNR